MSDLIPFEKIIERVKGDVDYIALEAYRKGVAMGTYINKPRWIPVTERLPEEGEMVLFTEGDEYPYTVIVGCIERGKWEYRDDMSTALKPKPIAWMPLPDPYEEEQ